MIVDSIPARNHRRIFMSYEHRNGERAVRCASEGPRRATVSLSGSETMGSVVA